MNARSKVFALMVCCACFAFAWRVTSHLSFDAWTDLSPDQGPDQSEEELAAWMTIWNTAKSCSCATCMTQFNAYFMNKYDASKKPFLTPSENLTEEEFKWFKLLQNEKGDLTKYLEQKQRLFTVFPAKPDVAEPRRDRCRSCAVVGNSGNLKGSRYGHEIDSQDVVIRMNQGRTRGFEEDVGTRTTHRVMYPESAIDLDNSTHLVLFPFKILDLQWVIDACTTGFHGHSYAPVIPKIKANKNLVMIVNPAFMKYTHTVWLSKKGRYPSTGFMTVILALHICDEVKIFGFGADERGNWNHYWEELKNKNLKTGNHPGSIEHSLILELAKQNKVTFFRGW